MEIFPKIETVNGFPAVYFKELDLIAISDLQLGEEMYLAEKGIFVPQVQLLEEKRTIRKIFRKVKAKRILINGDFKHEFGEASKQEWREVIDFTNFLREYFDEIIVVRGNHDNYLLTIASKLDIKVFDPFYEENGYLFTHGHKKIDFEKGFHTLIIGHEEPAILIKKGFDRGKFKAIIYGKLKNKRLICLPAFSYFSGGTEINLVDKEDLLSPILKEADVDELEVIIVDEEIGELKVGKIKDLKKEIF